MKYSLLQGDLKIKIIPILQNIISYNKLELSNLYDAIQESKNEIDFTKRGKPADILNNDFEVFFEKTGLGIDLPIWFEWEKDKKKTMIIGRDPQRNHHNNELIISSPFGLANKKGRESIKNKYWQFTEPLLENNRIYITDVYKLFAKNITDRKLIRKDKVTHYRILKQEIDVIKPDNIITIGKDAKIAISKILECSTESPHLTTKQGIDIYFVPHISSMVLQNFIPIANLFLSIGKLKNESHLQKIGKDILDYKDELFK
ncbi:uracil DNA glycosylase superfamily protein [Mariniflexile fucanivorans]|uniref:Uracil DNA glycosylase superfamily protein n=1 Tax=Mariniflexile fucanivorans TaxID=264023 RepID=A0A4R1RS42_9FLAO|nr:uracil-DNA glycosylase family protein [Mariniflexile fucanivorans]TCL69288.1 uracil DNA glycosylase superfamily protein [Mariniflexile fucanivorans]